MLTKTKFKDVDECVARYYLACEKYNGIAATLKAADDRRRELNVQLGMVDKDIEKFRAELNIAYTERNKAGNNLLTQVNNEATSGG